MLEHVANADKLDGASRFSVGEQVRTDEPIFGIFSCLSQSCQSQTVFRNCTMLTRFPFISTIHG